jgi:hypothetical protein
MFGVNIANLHNLITEDHLFPAIKILFWDKMFDR